MNSNGNDYDHSHKGHTIISQSSALPQSDGSKTRLLHGITTIALHRLNLPALPCTRLVPAHFIWL
jgi:hypothetical protein